MKCKCYECEFREPCEKEYGRLGIDAEDCSAIEDSHFCLLSWKPFIDACKRCNEHIKGEQNDLVYK